MHQGPFRDRPNPLAGKVFAQLDRADPDVQQKMRMGQPNFFLQFDRRGINPFIDRFEVDLPAEGTVRGTVVVVVVEFSVIAGISMLMGSSVPSRHWQIRHQAEC